MINVEVGAEVIVKDAPTEIVKWCRERYGKIQSNTQMLRLRKRKRGHIHYYDAVEERR